MTTVTIVSLQMGYYQIYCDMSQLVNKWTRGKSAFKGVTLIVPFSILATEPSYASKLDISSFVERANLIDWSKMFIEGIPCMRDIIIGAGDIVRNMTKSLSPSKHSL